MMKSYTCTLSAPFYETHSELLDTSDPNLIEHILTLGIQSFESNKEYDVADVDKIIESKMKKEKQIFESQKQIFEQNKQDHREIIQQNDLDMKSLREELNSVRKTRDADISELSKTHSQEISDRIKHQEELTVLTFKTKVSEQEKMIVRLNETVSSISKDKEQLTQRFADDLQKHLSLHKDQDEKNNVKLQTTKQDHIDLLEKHLLEKEDTYKNMIIEKDAKHHAVNQQLVELKAENEKKHNNKFVGNIGEESIKDFLRKTYPTISIEDTHGSTHNGDIKMTFNDGTTILFEVRNYANPVSTESAKTLIRDINHQNVDAGILVSLNSGIVGKQDMEIELSENNKIQIFCHNVADDISKLKGAIEMIKNIKKNIESFSDEMKEDLISNLRTTQTSIKDLTVQISVFSRIRDDMLESNKNMLMLFNVQHADYTTFKVAQLKKELTKFGLPTTGKKAELLERLLAHTE